MCPAMADEIGIGKDEVNLVSTITLRLTWRQRLKAVLYGRVTVMLKTQVEPTPAYSYQSTLIGAL